MSRSGDIVGTDFENIKKNAFKVLPTYFTLETVSLKIVYLRK